MLVFLLIFVCLKKQIIECLAYMHGVFCVCVYLFFLGGGGVQAKPLPLSRPPTQRYCSSVATVSMVTPEISLFLQL